MPRNPGSGEVPQYSSGTGPRGRAAPGRPGVRLEAEQAGGLTVIHDYGHDGTGVFWSWGCAADVQARAGFLDDIHGGGEGLREADALIRRLVPDLVDGVDRPGPLVVLADGGEEPALRAAVGGVPVAVVQLDLLDVRGPARVVDAE